MGCGALPAVDKQIDLRVRVAVILLLLYGQPLSRIVRLTIDDILTTGDTVLIRFGVPPTPVPEPFAGLLLSLIDQRTNMRTATNPNSRWLFPGRRAGQPLRPETLGKQTAKNGTPQHRRRPRRRGPPTRAPSTCPGGPRRPRHPLHHRPPAPRPGRRHLEPLRPRRPRPVTNRSQPDRLPTTRIRVSASPEPWWLR